VGRHEPARDRSGAQADPIALPAGAAFVSLFAVVELGGIARFPRMTKLAEIPEAIRRLDPSEQQALRHWLDENAEETPEMLAAIDKGLHSLATEPTVSAEDMRRKVSKFM
jgi:hypothetical protein